MSLSQILKARGFRAPLCLGHKYISELWAGESDKASPTLDILGVETKQSSFCFLWFVLDFLFPTNRVVHLEYRSQKS